MRDDELQEFIEKYNQADEKPSTALELILFIYRNGFAIYRKSE